MRLPKQTLIKSSQTSSLIKITPTIGEKKNQPNDYDALFESNNKKTRRNKNLTFNTNMICQLWPQIKGSSFTTHFCSYQTFIINVLKTGSNRPVKPIEPVIVNLAGTI